MKLPALPFQSKSKSLADRLKADGRDLVRSIPERLESSRKQALAVAGAATGAAAGFAFWRSQRNGGPTVHQDPAQPHAPWKMKPQSKKPVTDSKAAAASASGTRSK
jgi:hypothetical protein